MCVKIKNTYLTCTPYYFNKLNLDFSHFFTSWNNGVLALFRSMGYSRKYVNLISTKPSYTIVQALRNLKMYWFLACNWNYINLAFSFNNDCLSHKINIFRPLKFMVELLALLSIICKSLTLCLLAFILVFILH